MPRGWSLEPTDQNQEPQRIIPRPWNLMETARLDLKSYGPGTPFFLPLSPFLNGNGYNCSPVSPPPPLRTRFLVSQIYNGKGYLPQHGLYSPIPNLDLDDTWDFWDLDEKLSRVENLRDLERGWIDFACEQMWIFGRQRADWGRQNSPSQRCPHPNHQNLWINYLMRKKGLWRCG